MVDFNFSQYVEYLMNNVSKNDEIVFFCIGSNRVIGDCLGPITGTLIEQNCEGSNVYGNLYETVTYENITSKLYEIRSKFERPYIIAIDAALSTRANVGKIFIDDKGINFGESLGKNNGCIGDIGIKVVVGIDYNDAVLNFESLQNTSMSDVVDLSKKTFEGIRVLLNK